VGVALSVPDADRFVAALRALDVVARIDGGAVVCDLRTVDPRDDPTLVDALRAATRVAGA
jgi:hypothetical protein